MVRSKDKELGYKAYFIYRCLLNVQSLFIVFAFAGLISTLVGTIGNSVAQENLTYFTAPILDNLTSIAEGNSTLSNSTNTTDSNGEDEGEDDEGEEN